MKNALVVEDNPINMELVIEILTANGFSADGAVNGEEAVARVESEAYDIVLMDIELPGIDDYISKPLDMTVFIEKIK